MLWLGILLSLSHACSSNLRRSKKFISSLGQGFLHRLSVSREPTGRATRRESASGLEWLRCNKRACWYIRLNDNLSKDVAVYNWLHHHPDKSSTEQKVGIDGRRRLTLQGLVGDGHIIPSTPKGMVLFESLICPSDLVLIEVFSP